MSSSEKCYQNGRQRFGINIMGLTFQNTVLGMGNGIYKGSPCFSFGLPLDLDESFGRLVEIIIRGMEKA